MNSVEQLVQDNLALAYHAKLQLLPKYKGIDEDIIESDVLYGLFKAAKALNTSRAKLTTLAHYCIRNQVKNSVRYWLTPTRNVYKTRTGQEIALLRLSVKNNPEVYDIYEDIKKFLTWEERVILRTVFWEGISPVEFSKMLGNYKSWANQKIRCISKKIRDLKQYATN
ncbi:sigma-70 family RNA polymerase sigma factor [Candidatus Parcubacteria bacterium]|nr:MAG: sigma-70 family RNA polymerase sigma factor [Candidatus Parcubacteria bacterium]